MLDSLYRRPRGRKVAPLLRALTGGRVGAVPEGRRRRSCGSRRLLAGGLGDARVRRREGKSVADIGSGDGIIDLALALRGPAA